MSDLLRRLRGLMLARPKLVQSNGVLIAQCGEHDVLFDSDASCQFFVEAYDAVPALLDQIDTHKATIEILQGPALERTKSSLAIAEAENKVLATRVAQLEREVQAEVEIRTKAQDAARHGSIVARKTVSLLREIEQLREELEKARNGG